MPTPPPPLFRARICKRLRSPGIDSEASVHVTFTNSGSVLECHCNTWGAGYKRHTHTVHYVLTESTGTVWYPTVLEFLVKPQNQKTDRALPVQASVPSLPACLYRACLPPKACPLQKACPACLKPVKASCRDGALDTFWCSWVGPYPRTYVYAVYSFV